MSVAKQLKKCPLCLEPILVGATRCKHCQADLAGSKSKNKGRLGRYQTFRMGFLTGLLFSLILAVLAWAHVFGGDG